MSEDRLFCCETCFHAGKILTQFGVIDCNCDQKPFLHREWKRNELSLNVASSRTWENKVVFLDQGNHGLRATVYDDVMMEKNRLYYFEAKVIERYGRMPVRVGLAVRPYILCDWKEEPESWCFGDLRIFHRRDKCHRCDEKLSGFGLGSTVGMYVNMMNGTVEYFLNGESLGKAIDGLQDKILYPFVKSSYANNAVSLTVATEIKPTLQFLCCEVIRRHDQLIRRLERNSVLLKLYKIISYWDLPPYQESGGKILSLTNLADFFCTNFDYMVVFGNTNTCKCPKVIKKMFIYDHRQYNSIKYWSTVWSTTDATQDYRLYNEYLMKSEGCTYRNLSKLYKFSKLTYVIKEDKIHIIFDTNASETNNFIMFKHSEKRENDPHKKCVIIRDYYNSCKNYAKYSMCNIRLLLDTCDCESNGDSNLYDDMDYKDSTMSCNGNGTYTLEFILCPKSKASVNFTKEPRIDYISAWELDDFPTDTKLMPKSLRNIKHKCAIC